MSQSRDVAMAVACGPLQITIRAEGVSWTPDVADDMVRRVSDLWRQALLDTSPYGIFAFDTDDDMSDEELAALMESNEEGTDG